MSLTNLLNDIGDDADLLTRSDEWLEQERKIVASQLDDRARELEKLLLAQRIKRLLQQKNLVAVQQILRTADGEMKDIIIRLMKLPDALHLLERHRRDTIDDVNVAAQLMNWDYDGYDISTSRALRPTA
jgi:hypothetical protein